MSLNPLFLFILFSMGYVFGLLIRNPTAGKFLIFGFAGIFIYEPVKEAGLLASAAFVAGIVCHHVRLLTIFEGFPRSSFRRAERFHDQGQEKPQQKRRKAAESTEETHKRYERYRRQQREKDEGPSGEEGQAQGSEQHASSQEESVAQGRGSTSHHSDTHSSHAAGSSKPNDRGQAEQEELRRERAKLKREQDRLKAEREQLRKDRTPPPDNRTDEQILGVSGQYTLAELKQARNSEVKRWNTSNMVNKPPHLKREAEEEAKKINLAYERLSKKFRGKPA